MRSQIIKPPLGSKINVAHPLANGLAGCWMFNEGGGQKAFDGRGTSTGTLSGGPTYKKTTRGNAVTFSGAGSINVGNSSALKITGPITIYACINLPNFTNLSFIINKTGSVNTGVPAPYDFYIQDTTGLPVLAKGNGAGATPGTNYNQFVGSTGLTANTWNHVAVTMSGSNNGTVTHYLNGVVNGSGSLSFSGASTDGGANALIGSRADGGIFTGLMGHIYIYNRVLSATEIKQLYVNPYAIYVNRWSIMPSADVSVISSKLSLLGVG